ncbi:PfkB family carbohydrate kinase [Streptomyces sp. NPDC088400]|uniref:PfkB family carbohydrate kinase n=1 Tax=Streptomyces sp. NPDC088400 TaxID=3365861 RepID=UPI0037F34F31
MVTFLPSKPGPLADVPSFDRTIGGAESNVACALAAAGHTVRWVSRVGADGFGDHLVDAIAAYGVDTSGVRRDPDRPTGIYFRTATDRDTAAHEVAYYRAGSAASAMSPQTMPYEDLRSARVLHLSGITAALSEDCLALMRDLTAPRPGRPLVSFDVNHRPGLWRDPSAARVLLDLARGADLVFVGEDEAALAWGLHGADAIRAALPEPETLVVKRGSAGATVYTREAGAGPVPGAGAASPGDTASADAISAAVTSAAVTSADATSAAVTSADVTSGAHALDLVAPDTVISVPALRVDVVAPVGAGDAFAAGFLSATLRGLPAAARLRHGHLMAAAALTVPGDLGTPPSRADADHLAGLDADAWGTLRLGPGWTGATEPEPPATGPEVPAAEPEVRIP